MKRSLLFVLGILLAAACSETPTIPDDDDDDGPGPDPDSVFEIPVLGHGVVTERYTAEVAVSGTTAYTTSWSFRDLPGNTVYIWDVSGDQPVLVDTLLVPGANTLGDVQISPDGSLLVVPTEFDGSIVLYDRSDARAPELITQFQYGAIADGVHTVKLAITAALLPPLHGSGEE